MMLRCVEAPDALADRLELTRPSRFDDGTAMAEADARERAGWGDEEPIPDEVRADEGDATGSERGCCEGPPRHRTEDRR